MDEKVLESITALIRNQLTAQLAWTALVSVAAAWIGAYLGAYLGKKAEHRADREDFRQMLDDQITQTFETEKVKSSIADASGRAMEHLRKDLEREMAFTTFQRDLIARHQDALVSAVKNSTTIADLAKYEWREEEIDDRRPKMTGYLHDLKMSAGVECTP